MTETMPAVFTGRTTPVATPAAQREAFDTQLAKAQALAQMGSQLPAAYRGPGGVGAMLLALDFATRHDVDIIDVIRWVSFLNGKPIIETDLAVKLAGRDGIRVQVEDLTDGRDGARARLHGPDGTVYDWWEYTHDDANKASLFDKKGPWIDHPKIMYRHRARKHAIQFDGPMVGVQVLPAEPDDVEVVESEQARDKLEPEVDRPKPTVAELREAFKAAKWDKGDISAWLEQEGHDPELTTAVKLANSPVGVELMVVLAGEV